MTQAATLNGNQTQYVPLSIFGDNALKLSPDDYPNGAYSEQHSHYNKWWSYFKGYILNKKDENNVEMYPVKLNIIRPSVINHAAVLLGQYQDDQIVQFSVKNNESISKEQGSKVSKASNILWAINDGDESLIEQALLMQVFGGCFYKVAWLPTRRKWPIRYIPVDPRACFPVWDSDDPKRLVSIEVVHQVPRPTAEARYRVDLGGSSTKYGTDYATVHEVWNEVEYSVTVDGKTAQWGDNSPMEGANPFFDPVFGHNIVPYTYIPRIRTGDWFGDSLVAGMIGAQNELNANLALLGDGVAETVHQPTWVRNRPKGAQGLNRPRNEIIDLGMGQFGQDSPEMGRVPGGEINPSMKDYVVNDLMTLSRESSNMPDVAFGKTDASIRSALTLKYMMWPAINVGLMYRKNASAAFKQMTYQAFVVAHSKRQFNSSINGVQSIGIDPVTPEMIETTLLGHKTNWPPMLPDDRAELVNEIVQRIQTETISPETAIRRLDGSDELEEELARIDEHVQKTADRAMKMAEAQAKVKSENQPSGDRTNKAQAAGGRKSSKE